MTDLALGNNETANKAGTFSLSRISTGAGHFQA